jgi:Domain of unknown function (DUF6398)/Plasmid pRiA4b ORF-3-like protein
MPKTVKEASIPASSQTAYDAIVKLIDTFCEAHLGYEYQMLCRKLAAALARKRPSPLTRGKLETWACGIIRTIGWVNFLDDSSNSPHMKLTAIDKGPMDPNARRYVLSHALEIQQEQPNPPIGRVDETTLESLGLKVSDRFGYWFDFGDDWWHQINVEAIEDMVLRGKYPKVTKRVGKSPPQYADEDG